MKYISPRKMTVVSVSGRSVALEKGVPTYCPPQMHKELIERGVVPEEDIPEPEGDGGPVEPTLPAEREAALFAVFEKIVLRSRREEFTAVGVPHLAVLGQELSWAPLSAKERDAAWQKFTLAKSEV